MDTDIKKGFERIENQIQDLAGAVKRTDERLEDLATTVKRTDERLEDLATTVKRTDERLEDLATTVKRTEGHLEDLAIMVKEGFDAVDKRFERVDKRFERVDGDIRDLRFELETQYPTKAYLDEKLTDLAVQIIARMEQLFEKEKKFKFKLIEILKKNSLASEEDLLLLEELAKG